MIYLDYAATTPISDEALEVYTSVSKRYYGNSSSLHDFGSSAKQILEASAKTIARTINARDKDLYFTSGASESSFLAINSLLRAIPEDKGRHIITTGIEHSSVRNVFNKLEEEGYEVTRIASGPDAVINVENVQNAIREDTVLASIQFVNSETGVIQDLAGIGSLLKKKGIRIHSDAVQAYGKIPVDVHQLNVDALSFSSHKIYGPKGIGAAWINPKVKWKPIFPGQSAGKGFKPGTSDVPSIAAFATAAKAVHQNLEEETDRIRDFRDSLLEQLKASGVTFVEEGHPEKKVPHILGLRFPGMEGQYFMLECNQAGLAISTGSACQVGSEKPNTTLMAMGKNEQESREFVRLSFGKHNTADQIPVIIEKMNSILKRHYEKTNFNQSSKEELTS